MDAWIVPAFCSGSYPRGALKTRRCIGLDGWIVPAFCSGLSPRGSLKTGRCSGLDVWIVPAFCSGSSMHRALKLEWSSESDAIFLFSFFTQCYYPHTLRESVSPVCRIFVLENLFKIGTHCYFTMFSHLLFMDSLDSHTTHRLLKYKLHTTQYKLTTTQYKQYAAHCKLHTIHCTQKTAHYTLLTRH